jgi:hypothetical protein
MHSKLWLENLKGRALGDVRLEVFTAAMIQVKAFYSVIPCSAAVGY